MTINDSPAHVSTNNVAKALGVSVSTVKRWVDEGVLPAQKTAGGHRKILLADVIELTRRGDLPHADLAFLVEGAESEANARPDQSADQLHRALREGDAELVRTLIHGAFRRGESIENLADHSIGPAMQRIGSDWEKGRIDVMEEHRASQICAAVLYELKALIEKRGHRSRPRAVGGAAPNDYSVLPSLLAEMVLVDAGWDAINLGPNTPFASFTKAMRDLRPRLIWISVCHLANDSEFIDAYRSFYESAEKAGVAVAIGGGALVESLRTRIPYTTFGDGLTHLAAFARTLHRPANPPRRGRPRREP